MRGFPLSPPAIVRPMHAAPRPAPTEEQMRQAISDAVHHAMSVVGIEGVRAMSMFPSSSKRKAASGEAE